MLADYQAERREINLGDTSFTVGGVSFNGLTQLIRTHFDDLESLVNLAKESTSGNLDHITEADIESIILSFLADAPGFIANVIAVAAGEHTEQAVRAAGSIPAPKQVEVLMNIVELTFMEVGGVKKGIGALLKMLPQTANTSANKVQS